MQRMPLSFHVAHCRAVSKIKIYRPSSIAFLDQSICRTCGKLYTHFLRLQLVLGQSQQDVFVDRENYSNGNPIFVYSYLNASAGRMRDADQDGYRVATKETRTANRATQAPSMARGAKGT